LQERPLAKVGWTCPPQSTVATPLSLIRSLAPLFQQNFPRYWTEPPHIIGYVECTLYTTPIQSDLCSAIIWWSTCLWWTAWLRGRRLHTRAARR